MRTLQCVLSGRGVIRAHHASDFVRAHATPSVGAHGGSRASEPRDTVTAGEEAVEVRIEERWRY